MIVALIDNGSLEPAAHRELRAVASALAVRIGAPVHAVSWRHSDRLAPADLGGAPAWVLASFIRSMHALGQRQFVLAPWFISAQGAIGSALRDELGKLRAELGGFDFAFSPGLAASGAMPAIVAEHVRETIAARALARPSVVLVDHGGPSRASAALRDRLAAECRASLGDEIATLTAASLEGAHPPHLADALRAPGLARRDVIVAPLFLAPGRHAGPAGDIARLCAAAPARCHLAPLVGAHPRARDALAVALGEFLSTLPVQTAA